MFRWRHNSDNQFQRPKNLAMSPMRCREFIRLSERTFRTQRLRRQFANRVRFVNLATTNSVSPPDRDWHGGGKRSKLGETRERRHEKLVGNFFGAVSRLQEAATSTGRHWLKDIGGRVRLTAPPPAG